MDGVQGSRKLAVVALMTAIAVVLNGLTIPAPYEPFLLYGVWEVPILLSLLLVGPWGGVASAGLNAMALEAVNPGPLPTGPFYNFVAEMATFAGVLAATRAGRKWGARTGYVVGAATAMGAAARTAVMSAVNWLALPQQPPIGFAVPESVLPGYLVFIGIFNFTVVLYTVPLAFTLRSAIAPRFIPTSPAPARG